MKNSDANAIERVFRVCQGAAVRGLAKGPSVSVILRSTSGDCITARGTASAWNGVHSARQAGA